MATHNKRIAHYTPRIAARICENIALGSTIKAALALEPLGPSLATFWKWLDTYPEFRDKFERAQQLQATMHADRILEMAVEVVANPTKAGAYKVASDILKWQAEIRDPKKYGQKVQHELKAPPLKPEDLKSEIKRLEEELGVIADTKQEPNKAALPAPGQLQ
jgi:terminase small subunit-like protein